jgi:hypothetical protein
MQLYGQIMIILALAKRTRLICWVDHNMHLQVSIGIPQEILMSMKMYSFPTYKLETTWMTFIYYKSGRGLYHSGLAAAGARAP